MIPSLPRPVALRLILIRSSLLVGLLLFGGVTWYQQHHGHVATLSDAKALQFRYVFIGLCAMALAGMVVLRARLGRATDVTTQTSVYIIGYAMAECAALFGAVAWYIGGDRYLYIAGIVLMAVAMQVLPVRSV